jgi:hypothetical protein
MTKSAERTIVLVQERRVIQVMAMVAIAIHRAAANKNVTIRHTTALFDLSSLLKQGITLRRLEEIGADTKTLFSTQPLVASSTVKLLMEPGRFGNTNIFEMHVVQRVIDTLDKAASKRMLTPEEEEALAFCADELEAFLERLCERQEE